MAVAKIETEQLSEYCTNKGVSLRVDRDKGIIYGCKMLGNQSRNAGSKSYAYPYETRLKAVPLYEGIVSNVDHHKDGKEVSYRDRIGIFRNVVAKPEGTFGDYHYNPKHELAEQLAWDAENAPEKLGFSHLAEGRIVRKNGVATCEQITKAKSCDLVADPATTVGMFESMETIPADQTDLAEHAFSAFSDGRLILEGQGTLQEKTTRLTEVLSVLMGELGATTTITENTQVGIEYKDLTVEALRENRKDLVEILTGTDNATKLTKQVETLTESLKAQATELATELAAFKAKEEVATKALAIATELKESHFDTSDVKVCSPVFMASLQSAPDAAARKLLIEDRKGVMSNLRESHRQAAPFTPVVEAVAGYTAPKSKSDFLGRV